MTKIALKNVKIKGIKTVIPSNYIDIDDEIEFFENNPKKLARAKKMMGYGRRYLADEDTTVTDMAIDAAEKLIKEMNYDKNKIDLLIFVNQKPDYREPADACIAHGKLGLKTDCAAIDILLGCSGYVYALWTAMSMMQGGNIKSCLLLAGDIASYGIPQSNRKSAQLFGDAASATILEYDESAQKSYFVTGTDGKRWDRIVTPFGGIKLAPCAKDLDLKVEDENGNTWTCKQPMMKGEDVFNFSIETAPEIIADILRLANKSVDDVDFYSIHQANKQIVETIVMKSGIPYEKAPTETFTKYANNSTNSVVTVICDQLYDKKAKDVVICAFGIGLSWGCCLVDFEQVYNGGISTYKNSKKVSREKQIDYWIKYFKGEE